MTGSCSRKPMSRRAAVMPLAASALLGMVLGAGCAAAGPNEGRVREDVVRVGTEDGRTLVMPIVHDDFVEGGVVMAQREDVWSILPLVFEDVDLPPPAVDEGTWTMAVQNHTIMRRLGDSPLSNLLECGRDMSGYHADTHRIRLSVRTWLRPAAQGTEVRTRVEARAASVEGRAGTIQCTSKGVLEARIANAAQARISG